MRHLTACGVLALLAACEARINAPPVDGAAGADAIAVDPAADAMIPTPAPDAPDAAPQFGPWSTPAKVAPASTTLAEDDVTMSEDALEMIFAIDSSTGKDLYAVSRASTTTDWKPTPTKLSFDSATASDESPRLSADGKTLFFASGRDSGNGTLDIFAVDRALAGSTTTWGTPHQVARVNTAATDKWYMRCGADHYVVVRTDASGAGDLYEGTVGSAPVAIAALNAADNDTAPFITDDCLTIYFASARVAPMRIFSATRTAIDAPWQSPVVMHDFDALGGNQEDPWISADGHTFAFATDVAGKGNKDIYLSTR
jgi:Tol biopolymer transport system component